MRRALSLFAKAATTADGSVASSSSCLGVVATRGGVVGTSSSSSSSGALLIGSTSNCHRRSFSALFLGEGSVAKRALDSNEQRRVSSRSASTTATAAAAAATTGAATAAKPLTSKKTPPPSPTTAASTPSPPPSQSPKTSAASPPYFEVVGKLEGRLPPPSSQQQSNPVFAVVDFGGTQHKACPGDLLYADGWLGGAVDVNDVVRLTRVLAAGSASKSRIGRPVLEGASVTAAVEELFLDAKQLHFVKRRRKASRRLKGHRQPLTALRVLEVEGAGV